VLDWRFTTTLKRGEAAYEARNYNYTAHVCDDWQLDMTGQLMLLGKSHQIGMQDERINRCGPNANGWDWTGRSESVSGFFPIAIWIRHRDWTL
jgi:hypothetical protein